MMCHVNNPIQTIYGPPRTMPSVMWFLPVKGVENPTRPRSFCFCVFFCFFHLRLHQSQVCWLLFVDLFLYMFDHFYCLRLVVFVFLFKPFVGSGLAFVQPAAKLFSSPREWHLCSSNPSVWRGRENHRTCSHSHTVFTCFYSWTWENLISADKALWPVFLFSTHQIDGFQFPDFFQCDCSEKIWDLTTSSWQLQKEVDDNSW